MFHICRDIDEQKESRDLPEVGFELRTVSCCIHPGHAGSRPGLALVSGRIRRECGIRPRCKIPLRLDCASLPRHFPWKSGGAISKPSTLFPGSWNKLWSLILVLAVWAKLTSKDAISLSFRHCSLGVGTNFEVLEVLSGSR